MNTVRIIFPIKNKINPTEEESLAAMKAGMDKLIKLGAVKNIDIDELIIDSEIDNASGYAKAVIDQDNFLDASKLNTIGAGMSLSYEFEVEPEDKKFSDTLEDIKMFSAQTITERLRMAKAQPRVRLRYMVMDYKRFYKAQQRKIEKDPVYAKQLRNMFITDLMGLFNEVLPFIQEGKQLMQLLGLSTVTKGMNTVARDLSLAYKRALKMQATSGQIPKNQFKKLQTEYNKFITELLEQVMPGINNIVMKAEDTSKSEDTDELTNQRVAASIIKSFSEGSHPLVVVETSNMDQLIKIINAIKECGNPGHSFEIVIDPDLSEADGGSKKFGWDGDGSDRIFNVFCLDEADPKLAAEVDEVAKNYSFTESGRIRLFSEEVDE